MQEVTTKIMAKAVFRAEGRLMVIQLPDGTINLPGGHLEFGESPFEALQREVKEEIGYAIETEPRVAGVWSTKRPGDPIRLLIGYVIDLPQMRAFDYHEPAEPDGKCVWITPDQIPETPTQPYYQELLRGATNN